MLNWFRKRRIKREQAIYRCAEEIFQKQITKIKNQLGYNGSKWPFGISGSGSGLYLDHATMRQNARTVYHETPQAHALVNRFADTIADIGLKLECTPKAEILRIPEEKLETWASDVESRFDAWAKSKKQHRSEIITWYQSHRLYQIFQQRDNDIFVRLYYSKDRNLLNPLQFEFIDPSQIRGDDITTSHGVQLYSDGIKRDERGRETGYRIWVQQKNGFKYVDIPKTGRSGRIFMLHGFTPVFAGQGRGYSRLGHIIQEFQNITDFSFAQIKKR